jgi:biotin carboxyl carrier protein
MTDQLPLSPDDIADIVAILDASGYRELDLSTRRFRLRVSRGEGADAGFTQEWEWAGAAGSTPVAAAEAAADDPDAICAPLPGTFYHAPQPGAPPFVKPGDKVGPETVVGIIETMKLMNPVHAGRNGTVQAIVAPNATMVAKGETLVRLA